MKRIAAWIGGAAGAAFGYRLLRRRRAGAPDVAVELDDRADELRAKLAETRAEDSGDELDRTETVEERRRRVHEEGRSAMDEMGGE